MEFDFGKPNVGDGGVLHVFHLHGELNSELSLNNKEHSFPERISRKVVCYLVKCFDIKPQSVFLSQ